MIKTNVHDTTLKTFIVIGIALTAGILSKNSFVFIAAGIAVLAYLMKVYGIKSLIIGAVLLVIFSRPLISGLTYPWSNTYIQSAVLIITAVWVLWILWEKHIFYKTCFDIPLLAFFLCLVLSTLQSVNPILSLNYTYQFMCCILLYFIITNNFKTKETRNILIFTLLTSTVIVCLYGIYQYYWGLDKARMVVSLYHSGEYPPEFMSRLGARQAFSTFVYPPALAGFLVMVLPISLAVCLADKARWKFFLIPALILFGIAITFSKAGWLSCLLSMLIFLSVWLGYVKKIRKRLLITCLAVPFVIFMFFFLTNSIPRITLTGFLASFSVRLGYWKAIPSMVGDHLVFGSGIGTFGVIYPGYRLILARETQMAHNVYLQILVETGIAGFIVFSWLLISFLKNGSKFLLKGSQKLLTLGYFTGIIAFLIQSFVDFGFYIPGIAVTLFVFMALLAVQEKPEPVHISQGKGVKIILTAVILFLTIYMLWIVRRPLLGERCFMRSFNYAKKGKVNESISLLKKAIEYCPRHANYYFQLGLVYESMLASAANKKAPPPETYMWLDRAINCYEEAIEYNSHMAVYHSKLAWLYWSKSSGKNENLIEKAINELKNAAACYPALPKYHIQLGRLYHLAGMYENAKKEYMLAIKQKDAIYRESRKEKLNRDLEQVKIWLKEL